jgi:hypothetical protein
VSDYSDWRVYQAHDGDIATTVAIAIADDRGVDPIDLEFTLNDYVDPDALNDLFRGHTIPSADALVHLRIAGVDVCVSPGGEVRVPV